MSDRHGSNAAGWTCTRACLRGDEERTMRGRYGCSAAAPFPFQITLEMASAMLNAAAAMAHGDAAEWNGAHAPAPGGGR